MVDDGSARSAATWPLPTFHFTVDFGSGRRASFQEVSGLDSETRGIDYRHGDSPAVSPIKMPGTGKVSSVTLRKGILARDDGFWAWRSAVLMNTGERRTVTIDLLDEAGKPTMRWTLSNAWPTKFTGTDLQSDGNDIAVEAIELACDGISATNPSQ
jgi:phage tail-like protein